MWNDPNQQFYNQQPPPAGFMPGAGYPPGAGGYPPNPGYPPGGAGYTPNAGFPPGGGYPPPGYGPTIPIHGFPTDNTGGGGKFFFIYTINEYYIITQIVNKI